MAAKTGDELRGEFEKAFEKAKAAGDTRNLAPKEFEFKQAGDRVTGKLIGWEELVSKEHNNKFRKYMIDTGEQIISFLGGRQMDALIDGYRAKGKLVRITLEEFKKLEGDKQMGIFSFEMVGGRALED
jgi:hypothetical protein